MLTIEIKRVSIFWAFSLIFFKHMSFWCEFLDSHLIKYHSNIGDQIIVVFDLGMSTLHMGVLLGWVYVRSRSKRLRVKNNPCEPYFWTQDWFLKLGVFFWTESTKTRLENDATLMPLKLHQTLDPKTNTILIGSISLLVANNNTQI